MAEGKKIYLWGYMGSGKSYWAQRLSRHFDLPHFDLDIELEKRLGCSIRAFFKKHGEAAFREEEAQLLRDTANWPQSIIATGGGTPCFHENAPWMQQQGDCLFLDTAPLLLLQRLRRNRFRRPLLRNKSDEELEHFVREQLQDRRRYYEQAQHQIYLPEQDFFVFFKTLLQNRTP